MKTNEILEGNELIAEFMGASEKVIIKYNEDPKIWSCNVKYHSSWDWLMPVVEKIESIGRTSVEISGNHCTITPLIYNINVDALEYHRKIWRNNGNMYNTSKIKKVYACVIEFIKWYNLNK